METQPIVAIAGATGNVGSFLMPAFLEAVSQGRIKEVRALARKKTEATDKLEASGATVHIVDYEKKDTLIPALKGVDIVISTLADLSPEALASHSVLLEALSEAGVSVYFPSEFGWNHYIGRTKYDDHALFKVRKNHFAAAKAKPGLKVVLIFCQLIMEMIFGEWIGLDAKKGVWTIVGDGNTKAAVTSTKDLGRFTLEAALLAKKDPSKIPDERLEIMSDCYTFREYAAIFDSVSKKQTKFISKTVDPTEERFNTSAYFPELFAIFNDAGIGAITLEEANGNHLLNPGERVWKLRRIEEYAKEVGGIPPYGPEA